MQQYLPFTVLKHVASGVQSSAVGVATVLTVYGIETIGFNTSGDSINQVATVLTVYGIETRICTPTRGNTYGSVATVLTVYGIETLETLMES